MLIIRKMEIKYNHVKVDPWCHQVVYYDMDVRVGNRHEMSTSEIQISTLKNMSLIART